MLRLESMKQLLIPLIYLDADVLTAFLSIQSSGLSRLMGNHLLAAFQRFDVDW